LILLPHFTASLLLRTLLIWGALRVAVMIGSSAVLGGLALPAPADPWLLTPRAAGVVVGVVVAAGAVSLRRRNEDLFLLTLGYGRARQLTTIGLPVLVTEIAIGVAQRL
jgi:hypothetical protein